MSDAQMGPSRNERGQDLLGYLIGPIFLLLAVWFALEPTWQTIPENDLKLVASGDITTDPMRTIMVDPPVALMGGYDLRCQECHKLFVSLPETPRRLTQHQHIVLDHGLNDRCLNCHDRENRNRLALPGTKTIPFGKAARLCATCHGTTYRDWQSGMHGRTNGYWDPEFGEQVRLTCTQCHDPHSPAFGPMTALPGPHTLRMGDPNAASHATGTDVHNPLRLWSRGNNPGSEHDAEDSQDHESSPDHPEPEEP